MGCPSSVTTGVLVVVDGVDAIVTVVTDIAIVGDYIYDAYSVMGRMVV